MPSADKKFQHYRTLFMDTALASIKRGLETQQPAELVVVDYDPLLQEHRASFVTLHRQNALRGCIGSLEAGRPLIQDIARNAFSAAFRDPRFPAVTQPEVSELQIHISILSLPEALSFESEQDLISQLRLGTDGLIIEDHGYHGTFLPAVWDSLPNAEDFFNQLKLKAGLPKNYWSNTIKVSRYTTEVIHS